uniref:PKD/Chitinase domain-containing protein n=1 Tax=Acrobeloides nanus TaxID=290746 RepID=A0A914DX77_9BILA
MISSRLFCLVLILFSRISLVLSTSDDVATVPLNETETNSSNLHEAPLEILFYIEGPEQVQLPIENVKLKVVFNNSAQGNGNWTYYWETVEGIGLSYAEAFDKEEIVLSTLKNGTQHFRVTISDGKNQYHKDHILNVLSEKHANIPPKANIKPNGPITEYEHNNVVLDGEGSLDTDGKIASYEWKLKKGPTLQLPSMNTPILTLTSLTVGNYTFSLTVTDDNGAKDETEIDIVILEERDDPPKAKISRCGDSSTGSITVRLPLEVLYLCANSSTDDKGIESYSWTRKDNTQNPLDYTGSSSSILTLTNMKANELLGPYIFHLEVTDTKKQQDSTQINIFVNKAENQRPEANAGGNRTIYLPEVSTILEGIAKDDGTIVSYLWSQIDGPSTATIINGDNVKATVADLKEGLYQFRFNVTDDGGLQASDDLFLTVARSKNLPPVAHAENITVVLPTNIAILNASKSSDDAGVVGYQWIPYENVPACIMPLDRSDDKPVLLLGGLVPGKFLFNLTVWDQAQETNWTIVELTVESGQEQKNSVEIYMKQNLVDITYHLRRKLEARLGAALSSQIAEVTNVFVHFNEFGQQAESGLLRVVFHAEYDPESAVEMRDTLKRQSTPKKALKVVDALKAAEILQHEESMIREFSIIKIHSLYCYLDCSGHGVCNNFTKECECEDYWMSNLFSAFKRGSKQDCEWSTLYFSFFVIMVFTFMVSIGLHCFFKKKGYNPRRSRFSLFCCLRAAKETINKRKKFRKKKRYEPLKSDDIKKDDILINIPSSSELLSDTEECLFDARKNRPPLKLRERSFTNDSLDS